jgi:hypothetical protein
MTVVFLIYELLRGRMLVSLFLLEVPQKIFNALNKYLLCSFFHIFMTGT